MDTTLTIRRVPLASLHADPANARAHGEKNLEAIRASLARFGQAEPLVVQRSSSRVIGGNGRLVAMRAMGWTDADVVELDVDDLQATALGIALNRTGELAEWDQPALGKILEHLQDAHALDGVGFSEKEIGKLLDEIIASGESLDGITQDDVPAPPDVATARLGDRWILGSHVLLCGDSASREDVDRLLGGERIHLVNCDPPYNVKVEPRSNNAIAAGVSSFGGTHHQKLDLARHPLKAQATHDKLRPKDRPLANDFLPPEEFDRLLRAWFGNAAHALEPGRAFYVWGGYSNLGNYPSALAESGLYSAEAVGALGDIDRLALIRERTEARDRARLAIAAGGKGTTTAGTAKRQPVGASSRARSLPARRGTCRRQANPDAVPVAYMPRPR